MQNYLMLNNKKIELTTEQVKDIESSFGLIMLKDVDVGDTFKVGDFEFIVLEQGIGTTAVILKDFWETAKFDSNCNDYSESEIRKDLNSGFYEKLSNIVGDNNIVEHTVNLTADDGRTDYKHCDDKISLLTCEQYRKYVYVLEKHKISKWWWLSTAYSTKSNGYETAVRCVGSFGALGGSGCSCSSGIRPFCILKSNIFVSK